MADRLPILRYAVIVGCLCGAEIVVDDDCVTAVCPGCGEAYPLRFDGRLRRAATLLPPRMYLRVNTGATLLEGR